MKNIIIFLLVFPIFVSGCSEPAGGLKCNIGVADITPADSVNLAGFAARVGLSTGVHRSLKTHCLVVEKDTTRVCIITNVMMEIPIVMANVLREQISLKTGITVSNIFIHNTHTHSAPRVTGFSAEQGGTNFNFRKMFTETLVENAVRTANSKIDFVPFTIETGKGESDINCNRREENGPIDHDVYAVRLLDKKGKPIVSLLNFGCHPVSLGHRSRAVSTDFPGITVEEIQKEWGGEVFYFTGASGNVDPCGTLGAETSYAEERGKQLADAIRQIKFVKLKPEQTLCVCNAELHLPFRIPHITEEAVDAHVEEILQWTVSDTWKRDVATWQRETLEKIAKGEVKDYLPFQIASVRIGGLTLFFTQGEPFNEYQTILRESVPDTPVLFIAYTNGQNSYLPSKRAFQVDAYAYEKEQMHIYIKAPYPISEAMPDVYEAAAKQILSQTFN
jgi:hypothetical protein